MQRPPVQILLVEDNRGDVYLIRAALKEAGFAHSLTVLEDGEQASNFLLRREAYSGAARPDLLILDLNLPRVSGDEILELIRQTPDLMDLPIVILSSSMAPQDKALAQEVTRGLYLTKPYGLDDFFAVGGRIRAFYEAGQTTRT